MQFAEVWPSSPGLRNAVGRSGIKIPELLTPGLDARRHSPLVAGIMTRRELNCGKSKAFKRLDLQLVLSI
jgi:hypothetical protein